MPQSSGKGTYYGYCISKPSTLTDAPLHYCPGCTHGIVHRLVAQALEELGVEGKTVGVASVGCSVMCYDYFTCDMVQAPMDAPRLWLPA